MSDPLAPDAPPAPGPLVLFVCAANVCRSPLAAALFERDLPRDGWLSGVRVESAGVNALTGSLMCEVSAGRLTEAGTAPNDFVEAHRARPVTTELVTAASVVLTMEKEQRGTVAHLAPGQQSKVFTLREAVRLLQAVADEPVSARDADGASGRFAALDAVVDRMRRLRGTVPMVDLPPDEPARRFFRRRVAEPTDDGFTIVDGHVIDDAAHDRGLDAVTANVTALAALFARVAVG